MSIKTPEEKALRKAAKKARKEAQCQGSTTPSEAPDSSLISKKRKSEISHEDGDVAPAKKPKVFVEDTVSSGVSTPLDSISDSDKAAAKLAKKLRKEQKRLAKAQAAESLSIPAAAADAILVASSSEISSFLTENNLNYEPTDASSSYAPILAFENLPISEGIRSGLTQYSKPTPIQSAAWGILLKQRDGVCIARTGSGKTLAFGVPALRYIENLPSLPSKKSKKQKAVINVLVVAPTRELAMQTHDVLSELGKPLSISSACIYGGVSKDAQKDLLSSATTRIVVGTPGRIIDLCNEKALDLSSVTYLVLDEADRMLDKGFENDIRTIIASCAPSEQRQTMMFSATWPQSVRKLASDFMRDPIRITVGSDELAASTSIEQKVVVLENSRMKDYELTKTLNAHGFKVGAGKGGGSQRDKVLVFALYKKEAARVEQFLANKGYEVCCIQGDLGQAQRTKALEQFKTGNCNVLVATDVAARGLDIPKVELVVNYTFPLTIEDWVHRVGRTGRAARKGKAVTFFTPDDKAHAGELQKVMKDAGQGDNIPEELKAFGGTIKKKSHPIYGDHYNEELAGKKPTKITF